MFHLQNFVVKNIFQDVLCLCQPAGQTVEQRGDFLNILEIYF